MDVCLLIKQRLAELGLEQKDLASAAEVTDSYISQVLTRKKLPPAPDRTDIYENTGVRGNFCSESISVADSV
jgi:predicted transcriptional regulator